MYSLILKKFNGKALQVAGWWVHIHIVFTNKCYFSYSWKLRYNYIHIWSNEFFFMHMNIQLLNGLIYNAFVTYWVITSILYYFNFIIYTRRDFNVSLFLYILFWSIVFLVHGYILGSISLIKYFVFPITRHFVNNRIYIYHFGFSALRNWYSS